MNPDTSDSGAAVQQLPENANRPLRDGEVYTPYVPALQSPHEFTVKALFFGILFGVLFGSAKPSVLRSRSR
jgi:hypothetical protein